VTVKSCRRGEKHLAIKRKILDHNPRNNSLYYFPYWPFASVYHKQFLCRNFKFKRQNCLTF
jgi:hypothetical protein